MRKYIAFPEWLPRFFQYSPLFYAIQPVAELFADYEAWPTIEDYNDLFLNSTTCCKSIRFVEQTVKKTIGFADQYEPRIFLKGEVSTRYANWHDFFNMLVWRTFPRCKALLNAKHYQEMMIQWEKGLHIRTAIQNLLTLFDESGAIVVSSETDLTTLLQTHQWKELFWQQRESVLQKMRFFIFGHAIYEKALQPYVGLTAKSIIFNVNAEFFQQPLSKQLAILDNCLVKYFESLLNQISTKQLMPLPVLGVPGWCIENQREEYYDNKAYFRGLSAFCH